MSGYRRAIITISEEEYRRLHEVDMRNRFGQETDQAQGNYEQHIRALEQQISSLQSQLAQARAGGMVKHPAPLLKVETALGPIDVDEQMLYVLLGDEDPDNQHLLEIILNRLAYLADAYRRCVEMLRPQLIGLTQYQNQRLEYARKLLDIMIRRSEPAQNRQAVSTQSAFNPDPALSARVRFAARLTQALQQAEYRNTGYTYTDPTRETAMVHLARATDGSQVTLLIKQHDSSGSSDHSPITRTGVLQTQEFLCNPAVCR